MPATPRLFLDDLTVGDTFVTDELTVTRDMILDFAKQFDPQTFHTDEAAAKETFFGGLAASGWHITALTMRLLVTSGIPLGEQGTGLIGAGAHLTWPSPTRPGDVLHVESEVVAITPSRSKPDRGIVTVLNRTLTSEGDVRQILEAKLVVFVRGASQ